MPTPRLGARRGAGGAVSLKKNKTNRLSYGVIILIVCGAAATILLTMIMLLDTAKPETYSEYSQELAKQAADLQQSFDSMLSTSSSSQGDKPIVIGYAISLIKCGDFQSDAAGLTDAALVLRHSLHKTSVRNPASGSTYDYKMYAIVHEQAAECSEVVQAAGFETLIVPAPIKPEEIEGDFLRRSIHKEWCCGSDEFIKLYAYTMMDHPVVVHVDLDFAFYKPMDTLFDAMIYDKDSPTGAAARARIELERPADPWPDRVDAFMTRDWPQVMPGRIPAYQAGFMVLRPDPKVFEIMIETVRKGHYVEGYGRDNGWGGKGYGVFVGAMAMQGLVAYVYDELLPGTWMELNQCRYNHMGMDVLYRNQPSFRANHPKAGQCRNDGDYCEDCMNTEFDKIYSVHYTQCRKPFQCISHGDKEHGRGRKTIPEDQVHLDHCMELMTHWHSLRTDLENQMVALTGDATVQEGRNGDHVKEVFQGHCNGEVEYINIKAKPETFARLGELYQ